MEKLKKEDSLIVKGIAIIFMLIHHLFAFPERLIEVSYISLFPFKIIGSTIEYLIGDFGKICVSLFFFISGYGIYLSFSKDDKTGNLKKIFKRLKKLFINYWVVFIIFVPIGLIFFRGYITKVIDYKEIILAIIGFSSAFNGEWWFLQYYIQILILYPLMTKAIGWNWKITLIVSILLCLTYRLHQTRLFVWQSSFLAGVYFAKFQYFKLIDNQYKKIKFKSIMIYLTIIIIFIVRFLLVKYIKFLPGYGIDFILSPLIIYTYLFVIKQIKSEKVFIFLGLHSVNIWLVHSFYCYYYFKKLTYFPKYSILVLIMLLLLSILSSYIIIFIIKIINKIKIIPKK